MSAEAKTPAAPVAPRDMSEAELAENLDKLTPAQFEFLLDIWQRKLFTDELSGKWKFDLLKEHRPQLFKKAQQPIPDTNNAGARSENASATTAVIKIPSRLGNMTALAGFLNEYFRGQICKQVQPNHISQWSRNNREFLGWLILDDEKTVPPALCCEVPNTKFYDPQVALEWFTQWILPQVKWRMKGNEEALTHSERMERFAERKAQRDDDVAEGRFRSVKIFNQHLTQFGLQINRAINDGEKMMKKAILQEIEKAKSRKAETVENLAAIADRALQLELIEDAVGRGVRVAIDALRASAAKAILEAEEAAVLHESHE